MLVQTNLAYASTNERETIYLYDLFDRYLKSISENSANTLRFYINDFKKFINNKDISTITVDDIQLIINSKKAQNLKDSTLYRYYQILQTVFNYAILHEYIDKNPCKRYCS